MKRGAIWAGFVACTLVGRIWADSYVPFTYSDIMGYQNDLYLFRGPIAENSPITDLSGGSLLARYGFWSSSMNSFDLSPIDQQQYSLQLSPFQENKSILSGLVHPNYFSNPSTPDFQFGMQILYTPDVSVPSFFYEAVLLAPDNPSAFIEARSLNVVGEKTLGENAINLGLLPEPSALSLLAFGFGALTMMRRRRS